ncbi:alkaline phosphatase [Polychaeton citri CBS 116435]|uniref:Alkaline phosphatase n=1 Tax=Polychaeton citri CBS 116435 TaxID=1314669 RepID=A0A9P4Q1R0_9PEZI|nr:alkaline phosphatase [Polychaeton citri CBS 116435]
MDSITLASSLVLRLCCYVFFRWIPGSHFPALIATCFAVYTPSFLYSIWHTTPYKVVSDELDIVARQTIDRDEPDEPAEIEVNETIEVEERGPEILKTLATGLPSPTSLFWSAVTFVINAVLALMALDLVYRATVFHPSHGLSMARTGYVSSNTARILVREPDAHHYPIFASYRYADPPTYGFRTHDTSWKSAGKIAWLEEDTDYTGSLTIADLKPDTKYQWVVSNNHTGTFITAPRPGHTSSREDSKNVFSFVHSSCLKNNVPYVPFTHALQNQGLRHLATALKKMKERAQFMMFLGDFIYADVPSRHGSSSEDFRREYRQIYSSPDWPAVAKDLPWLHVYDDHEVSNDWDQNTTGLFPAAYDPYYYYQVSVNPPPVRKAHSYFEFTQGPATFFMLDTRRYRSSNDATNGSDPLTAAPTKTMLGEQQLSDLLAWLKRPEPAGIRWKIVVSSIPFTQNWWFGAQDTWRGYLGERQIILEAMWDVGLQGGVGVIILSGDRHEFAATSFPPPPDGKEELTALGQLGAGAHALGAMHGNEFGRQLATRRKRWPLSSTVHEFSASPLNMFYLPIRTYSEVSASNPYNLSEEHYRSDVCIKYLPDGNSKFGSVSITNPSTSDQSVLHYKLFVDGEEAWSYTLTTPPDVGGGGRAKDAIWG